MLGCSILRNNSYSVAANHRSHPRSHHSVRHLQLQWLLSRSSKAPTPNPIDEVIKTQQTMKEVQRNPLENQGERDSKETVGKPWNLSERETEKSLEEIQKRSLENLGERDSKEKTACLSGPQISWPRSSSRYSRHSSLTLSFDARTHRTLKSYRGPSGSNRFHKHFP